MQFAIELYDCDRKRLDNVGFIRQTMLDAARKACAQIITEVFHRFSPQGISGVVIIAESHLAIHTWPEHAYAAVDLFTCADRLLSDKVIHHLHECLKADRVACVVLPRGPVIEDQTQCLVEQRPGPSLSAEGSSKILLEAPHTPR